MNIKPTQVSNVQKVDDEGKMCIDVVKPLLLLFLSWNVFDEHKVNAKFQCKQSRQWRENVDCCCKTVVVTHSIITCHCEAYEKTNYLGRHIFWGFDRKKNVVHPC